MAKKSLAGERGTQFNRGWRSIHMAKKKNAGGKKKRLGKTKYVCPNPGRPMGLEATVNKIMSDPDFAEFIAAQLCKAHHGDEAAISCVNSYYQPTGRELKGLCIDPVELNLQAQCTNNTAHLLIDVAAHSYARAARKRKRKR